MPLVPSRSPQRKLAAHIIKRFMARRVPAKRASLARPAGCTHENVTVEAGKTYLVRLISATSLLYTVS